MAQAGYLQADKTLFMCVCSSSSCSWLEQISFALCDSELITLYLLAMAWWLSHCKYWLVWVGFLYTVVDRLPSFFGVTKVSRKGMDPSALVVSAVNFIFSSMSLMWLKNSSLCSVSKMTKVLSTNLFHKCGVCGAVSRAFVSKFSMKILATMGLSGDPIAAPSYLFIILPLKHKICTS